jgi:hypothetical protein
MESRESLAPTLGTGAPRSEFRLSFEFLVRANRSEVEWLCENEPSKGEARLCVDFKPSSFQVGAFRSRDRLHGQAKEMQLKQEPSGSL